ncbi:transposase [Acetobacteraceae bacterium ESL0709]|nr:transposase [Acetobacteraceae bacterium ESL0697]MDF7677505.1 transposase [Acetobacteraceae bacterium ESL0709]
MTFYVLGYLLALHVTPADRSRTTGWDPLEGRPNTSVKLVWADQGYNGARAAEAAQNQGITLEIVKLSEAKRGFVLLPRRWVVERSFAWATRCRRLVKDYERYSSTLAAMHIIAFACFMLNNAPQILQQSA